MFLVGLQITGSFLNDGGGLLGAHEYHMSKVCQADSISSQDLIERRDSGISQHQMKGEFHPILVVGCDGFDL